MERSIERVLAMAKVLQGLHWVSGTWNLFRQLFNFSCNKDVCDLPGNVFCRLSILQLQWNRPGRKSCPPKERELSWRVSEWYHCIICTGKALFFSCPVLTGLKLHWMTTVSRIWFAFQTQSHQPVLESVQRSVAAARGSGSYYTHRRNNGECRHIQQCAGYSRPFPLQNLKQVVLKK